MGCQGCSKKRKKVKVASFSIRIPVESILDSNRTKEIQRKLEIYAKELINGKVN